VAVLFTFLDEAVNQDWLRHRRMNKRRTHARTRWCILSCYWICS